MLFIDFNWSSYWHQHFYGSRHNWWNGGERMEERGGVCLRRGHDLFGHWGNFSSQ